MFDLGGVLIDWDPRHLYRELFDDPAEMERFLAEVATSAWNREQDGGRPFAEGVAVLVAEYPEHRELIEAYQDRWSDMLGGGIDGTVAILENLHASGVPTYALSNWSAETFPQARARFPFLDLFDGIVISGEVGLLKPDEAIFEHLAERFGFDPAEAVFVDDLPDNVATARRLGFRAIRFTTPDDLRAELEDLGLLPPRSGVGQHRSA